MESNKNQQQGEPSMRNLTAILLLICTAVFGQDETEKFVVAISGKVKDENTADILATTINRAITNSDLYIVLPNDPELMKILKKTWKGNIVSDQTIISLAQNSNADHLCLAKITRYNDKDIISLQWVKLKTKQIQLGRTGRASGNLSKYDDFESKIEEAIKDMLGTAKNKNIKTFTDPRDNKQYKMVTIGDQTWMAENLNYKVNGSKCYDNKESNCQKYGRLYNRITVMDIDEKNLWLKSDKKHQGICPKDWHLPSAEEWEELVGIAGGRKKAGKKLISAEFNGTDDYGFSALLGGECYPIEQCKTCYDKECKDVGSAGVWYTSSLDGCGEGANIEYIEDSEIESGCGNIWIYYSVRCIKD
jgi:uncharacterized protein (TIGR02145 family)